MRTRPRNLDNNEMESYNFKVDECVKQQILVLNCTKMTDLHLQISLRFWHTQWVYNGWQSPNIFILFSFILCKYCQNFFVSLQPSLKVQGRISSLIAILITSRRGEFSIWMFGGNVSKFWSKKLWETFSTKDHLLLFLTNEEDALKWKHAAPTFYSAFCVVLRTYKL